MTSHVEPTAADVMCVLCGTVGTAETDPAKRIEFVVSALWWAAHHYERHPEALGKPEAYIVMVPRDET